MKFCETCLTKEATTRSKLCVECQKIADRKRKLTSYYKNKHKHPIRLKGIDETSREQRRRSYHKNKNKRTYFDTILNKTFKNVKSRSKKLKRDFDLTKEFVENLYEKQGGKCALTGLVFSDEKYNNCRRRPFAPSLDRIDSKRGYTQDNVRFVCSMVNTALGEFGDILFDKMCRSYIEDTLCRSKQRECQDTVIKVFNSNEEYATSDKDSGL